MDEAKYNHVFDILTAARDSIESTGIPDHELIAPFADFLAGLAISIGGEETVNQVIARMLRLVEDWKAGRLRAELN